MSIQPGQTLSHYTLLEKLGEGGMGVVWKAHDTTLGRDVAIKVLPETLSGDTERMHRLETEAKTVAALNHPNIVTLHTVEEAGGVRFLTMELVEGRTLKEHIPETGFAIDQFLELAIQLTDAVSAAHRKGVTHRDLKPSNVMITREGRLKVLDFGLARLERPAEDAAPQADATRTATGTSGVVGTLAYMSPEMLQQVPFDHRADIFALGAILHEMATGQLAFRGKTPAELAASVLRDTTGAVDELRPGLPRQLGRIVQRCLEKEPGERFQTARDLHDELTGLKAARAPASARRWPLVLVATLGLVAVLAVTVLGFRRPAPVTALPALAQLTFSQGVEEFPALSPHGTRLAYSTDRGGVRKIFVKQLPDGEETQITRGDHDEIQPAWSPDGTTLLFVRSPEPGRRVNLSDPFSIYYDGDLWSIDLESGEEHKLVAEAFNPSFSPDGERIAVDASWVGPRRLWLIDRRGLNPRQITAGDSEEVTHVRPRWSPDGTKLVFQSSERTKFDIRVVDVASQQVTIVTNDPARDHNPVFGPDGRTLYFSSYRSGGINIWSLAVDAGGRPQGRPAQITTGAGQDVWLTVAGRHLAFTTLKRNADLWQLPVDPVTGLRTGDPVELLATTREDNRGAWSPDGSKIAFNSDRGGSMNVWIYDLESGSTRQLTKGPGGDYQPTWSPDGSRVAFFSSRSGTPDIWSADVATGELKQITNGTAIEINPFYSPDGNRIAYHSDQSGRMEVWVVNPDGIEPRAVTDMGVIVSHFMRWVRDGEAILFRCLCDGSGQVAEVDLGSGRVSELPHVRGGAHLSLSPAGRRIMDVTNHRVLWSSPIEPGDAERVYEPEDSAIRVDYPCWSPDGSRVLFDRVRPEGGDIWWLTVGP